MDAIDGQRQPPTTVSELEQWILRSAVECGIVLKDGCAGFTPEEPPDLPDIAEQIGYADAIWPWRRLMVECVNYLTIQSLTFQSLLNLEPTEPSNFLRASWSLSTKAALDARCALHLCDHGFVAQASIVARACIEAIEAMSAFNLDRTSADAFVAAQTPDQANHAWYTLIRKKARQLMDAAFADVVAIDAETAQWRRHNRRILGSQGQQSG